MGRRIFLSSPSPSSFTFQPDSHTLGCIFCLTSDVRSLTQGSFTPQICLEYAAPVWCPYLVKDIHALENVQRRASRLALNQRKGEMSYEDRCKLLKWPTLSNRRTFLSLVECYHLKFEDIFDFTTTRSTRANHQYKLDVKPARLDCYKRSFFR